MDTFITGAIITYAIGALFLLVGGASMAHNGDFKERIIGARWLTSALIWPLALVAVLIYGFYKIAVGIIKYFVRMFKIGWTGSGRRVGIFDL